MRKSPLLTKIKFEPTFFQVLWRFAPSSRTLRVHYGAGFSLPLQGEAGGKGDSVFALPPAEPVNEISSDIFKYTPPVRKFRCWLARYAGSPADFRFKIKFFAFVPQSGTPEAGFSKF